MAWLCVGAFPKCATAARHRSFLLNPPPNFGGVDELWSKHYAAQEVRRRRRHTCVPSKNMCVHGHTYKLALTCAGVWWWRWFFSNKLYPFFLSYPILFQIHPASFNLGPVAIHPSFVASIHMFRRALSPTSASSNPRPRITITTRRILPTFSNK